MMRKTVFLSFRRPQRGRRNPFWWRCLLDRDIKTSETLVSFLLMGTCLLPHRLTDNPPSRWSSGQAQPPSLIRAGGTPTRDHANNCHQKVPLPDKGGARGGFSSGENESLRCLVITQADGDIKRDSSSPFGVVGMTKKGSCADSLVYAHLPTKIHPRPLPYPFLSG